jgi:uncharacterized tellurite resistance protein B-like protein
VTSLINIKNSDETDSNQLLRLIHAFIDIANADEFIHDNEVLLIQNALTTWNLNIKINKPKSGDRLEIQE